jgi:hypothetical protein
MDEQSHAFSDQLVDRVRKLEIQNRRIKSMILLILLCLGAVLFMAQARSSRGIEGRRFTLKDIKGRKRAELAMSVDHPVLSFYDAAGKALLDIGVDDDGPGMVLFGAANQKAAVVSSTENGPILSLYSRTGARRLNISVMSQGPAIGLLGPKGEAKAAFGTTGADNAYLQLFGSNERGGAQLYSAADRSMLRFLDSSDMPRTVVGILDKESSPGLVLNDSGGTSRAILMLTPAGPSLSLVDKEKNVAWRAP